MKLSANRYGAFWADVKDEKIVQVKAFEPHPLAFELNQAMIDVLCSKERVLRPSVRKSFLKDPQNSRPHLRGKDEFVEVSWEVALDLVAKILRQTYDKYGAKAVHGECYFWGASGAVSCANRCAHRMLNLLGGYVGESGDYSIGAGIVLVEHVLGMKNIYALGTSWNAVIKHAQNVVFWGCDPIITAQIGSRVPSREIYTNLERLKAAGKQIFSVDVYMNETANFFKAETLLVRPNTDAAMAIGMCAYLYQNNLHDENFLRTYCVGFEQFRDYFLGVNDGILKDTKWASKICGIDESKIENFALALAQQDTQIIIGRSVQRCDYGEQAYWSLIALAAFLGDIGKAGCGFDFGLAYSSSGGTIYKAPLLKNLAQNPTNAPSYTIPSSRFTQCLEGDTKILEHNGKQLKMPEFKLLFSTSGSIFTRHQDARRTAVALQKLETIITLDPFWTSQAKFSDIVLPVALAPERTDIDASNASGEYIFAIRPLVAPAGESKSDFWICREICKRLGLEMAFSEGKNEMLWVREFYADACEQGKKLGYAMPSFEEFWDKGYARFDKVDEKRSNFTMYEDFRADPVAHKLATLSGKIELFSQSIASMAYDDCTAHPSWFEPVEWLGNTSKFPLALVCAHSKYRLHSQLDNSEILRKKSKISGYEPVIMSANLAAKKGIKNGDVVRVFNDRGKILCGADVRENIRDDVVIVREGAWWQPDENGVCQNGNANALTLDKGSSKLSQSNIGHTTLVDVRKF